MTILKFKKEKAALTNKPVANFTSHISNFIITHNEALYNSDHKTIIHSPKTVTGHFDVPQGVELIGIEAFAGCKGLLSITIPDSVHKISMLAFADCENLQQIILKSTNIIELSEDSFRGVDKTKCLIYVPLQVQNEFIKANYWMEFKNIVAAKEAFELNSENRKQVI